MINISENDFRDALYNQHSEDFGSLITGRREIPDWEDDGFPSIRFLLKRQAEAKINSIIDGLEDMCLIASELRLENASTHPTRIDLLGNSESSGLSIIELKKSGQTERQAFTELLAYSSHFCSLFPGLSEDSLTSILVAPMESRTIRDAYAQELVSNKKNIIALKPDQQGEKFTLEVCYPDDSYYRFFENNFVSDHSIVAITVVFELVDGWIDSDLKTEGGGFPPSYTVDALNTISKTIASELESSGYHSIVYASQKWGEVAGRLPYPNSITVAAVNPFSLARTSVEGDTIYGRSDDGRLAQVQAIHDQLSTAGKEWFWVDTMGAAFEDKLMRKIRQSFKSATLTKLKPISCTLGINDWYGLKTNMLESVMTHNLQAHTTGLLRSIYLEYLEFLYQKGFDQIYFSDDLPGYSYKALTHFLAIWEIFSGLGFDGIENQT